MTTTAHSTIPTLAEIATAQADGFIFAFDRDRVPQGLVRLQRIYAAKLAQLEAFHCFFDEGQPDIVLRSASQELALRLPAGCPQITEIYAGLRDALSNELRVLEREIVTAHQDVTRDQAEMRLYGPAAKGEPDYVPRILELCKLVAPLAVRLAPEQSTAHAHAA